MTDHQSSQPSSVLIVGGGMSGFTTALELRKRGFRGAVTIVDPEGIPYDRPPLSKEYLLGQRNSEEIYLSKAEWFTDNSVDIVVAAATALDGHLRIVTLDDGTQLHADVIVLANGGAARKLPIPGGDLDTVLELRTMKDADRLRSQLCEGLSIAIIGAGLIGAETASAAQSHGAHVTLIDPIETPLVPVVGERLAKRLHSMHTDHGVATITGIPVEITRDASNLHTVVMQDGTRVEANTVLVGIGIVPRTDLVDGQQFKEDNGLIVNEYQQTSVPGVYAVGDVARTRLADGTLLRRAEHWEHAMFTGQTAAAAILHQEVPKHGASWFWSDRYSVHVEGVGSLDRGETLVHRDQDGVPAVTFSLNEDGTMAGCAAIDGGTTVRAARRIIDRGIIVDPQQLADSSIPLKKLARG